MYDAVEWTVAELAEKNSLKLHKMYTIIKRSEVPKGKRIFYSKTVLKSKINPPDAENPTGSLDKHKCRLTIAAYTKMLKQGVDYAEKHASWHGSLGLFANSYRNCCHEGPRHSLV